jgi:hypothetical protein
VLSATWLQQCEARSLLEPLLQQYEQWSLLERTVAAVLHIVATMVSAHIATMTLDTIVIFDTIP